MNTTIETSFINVAAASSSSTPSSSWKEILMNAYKNGQTNVTDQISYALNCLIKQLHKILTVTHQKKGPLFNKMLVSSFTAQNLIDCICKVLLETSTSDKLADYIGQLMVQLNMIEFDCQNKNSTRLSDDRKRLVRFLHPYMPRLVIIGGGHSGVLTACQLNDYFSIVLIDKNPHCTLKPAFPVILEKVDHVNKISINYSEILPSNVTFIHGLTKIVRQDGVFIEIAGKEPQIKHMLTNEYSDSNTDVRNCKFLSFDYLVIATGCNGWKNVPQMENPQKENKILYVDGYNMDMVELSVTAINQSNHDIVVIGGGSVGCEYFGSLAQTFPNRNCYLIQRSDMLMKPSKDAHKAATDTFAKMKNANVKFNCQVDRQEDSNILVVKSLESGEETRIKCCVCFLASGISPNTKMMNEYFGESMDENNYLKVNPSFQLWKSNSEYFNNIFVLGDANNADTEKLIQNADIHAEKFVEIAKSILKVSSPNSNEGILATYDNAPRVMAVSLGPKTGFLMKDNKIMFKSGVVNKLKSAIQNSTLKTYKKFQ
ncbi:predicted protein [Naegleria gruberi]|uniref:Predicted protein n=1 Tax=Naegleria gruberi TaxID=5762 RepID=D2VYP3_NAEGR|nr:uncharacterized protein NAEGRDRAFT_53307 [Naegleria gruberi]EFC38094.1 predicted protein [Naegleria gruberi]|eukprot:XP_002670838.1 predicted protein [Naegleria gruberi strain NEG-M]